MGEREEPVKRYSYHITFVALTALLLVPGAASGQQQDQDKSTSGQTQNDTQDQQSRRQRRRGAMRQRQHMAMLAEKLNLSEAQKEQFQKINQETRKQAMAIRQDSSISDDQKKDKVQALHKQAHQQMFSVLNDEQKQKLKEMREQHMKNQKGKGPGDQASARKASPAGEDDDPFAGMTSDDDDGPSGTF
jgi:hypothetical protein